MLYIFKLVVVIICVILGYFVIPIALLFTPIGSKTFSNKFIDSIWGNEIDSINGDAQYNKERSGVLAKNFPRFSWCAVRNPVNNLIHALGPKGTIEEIRISGDITYAVIDGKEYWCMNKYVKYPWLSEKFGVGWHIQLGYRLFPDHRRGMFFEVGEFFANTIVFNPFRFFMRIPK